MVKYFAPHFHSITVHSSDRYSVFISNYLTFFKEAYLLGKHGHCFASFKKKPSIRALYISSIRELGPAQKKEADKLRAEKAPF